MHNIRARIMLISDPRLHCSSTLVSITGLLVFSVSFPVPSLSPSPTHCSNFTPSQSLLYPTLLLSFSSFHCPSMSPTPTHHISTTPHRQATALQTTHPLPSLLPASPLPFPSFFPEGETLRERRNRQAGTWRRES